MIALSRHISDAPGLLTAIAAGGAASLLALLALTVDESDEAFANVYSGAVSLQNLLPRVPQRLLVGGVAGDRDGRRARDRPAQLPAVPLPARLVLRAALRGAARRLAARRAATTAATTSSACPRSGSRWSPPGSTGFCLYQWLYPQGPVVVDGPRRAHAARTRCRGAARRCRASWSHSGSPPSRALSRGGPYWRARDRADREPLARRPAGRRSTDRAAAPTTARGRCSVCACRRAWSRAARRATATRCCRRSCGSGRPSASSPGESTATFAFSYDGDRREMRVDALGDTWSATDIPPLHSARWAHVAPLSRARVPGRDPGRARAPLPRLLRRAGARARAAGTGRSSSTTTSTATCCGTSGC